MKQRTLTIAFVPAILLILSSVLALSPVNAASKVNFLSDPQVMVARDTTNKGCTRVVYLDLTNSRQVISQEPCPAGTVIGTFIETKSKATSQGEKFVVLPASWTTSSTLDANVEQSIVQMMDSLSASLLPSHSNVKVRPDNTCGSGHAGGNEYTVANYNWVGDVNTSYTSTETYYLTQDCTTVTVETADLQVNADDVQCFHSWNYDKYAAGLFHVPNTPALCPGDYFYHNVDLAYKAGYYYEEFVKNNIYQTYHNNNMGPLN